MADPESDNNPPNRKKKKQAKPQAEPPTQKEVPQTVSAQTPTEESTPAMMGQAPDPVAGEPAQKPKQKVKSFPTGPGVYLMKDAQGRVIYVGKAKNLKARAGSYFQKTAETDSRIRDWIGD
ncbi:MAG: GIY-YIG nuclease family protein, partial [Isosphaeraceae bacterium]